MKTIKIYWSKYKNSKFYKWYKGLPVAAVGLVAILSIILFLTLFFNRFWSGLGADPTREWLLPLTRNKQEFIEYATLYIYLITFGATMFAGLAVFLVFNDWKVQHNTVIEKEYLSEIYSKMRKITVHIEYIEHNIDNFLSSRIGTVDYRPDMRSINECVNIYNEISPLLFEYQNLFGDKELEKLINTFKILSNYSFETLYQIDKCIKKLNVEDKNERQKVKEFIREEREIFLTDKPEYWPHNFTIFRWNLSFNDLYQNLLPKLKVK